MIFRRRISAMVASILLGVWAISAPLVYAQTGDPATNPASGLRLAPTRQELTVEPGTSDNAKFTITNVTGGTIVIRSEVSDFEANDNGTIQLTEPEQPVPNSIKPFVTAVPDTTLASGESFDAIIPVTIPDGTAPGGYYGAMLFQAIPVKTVEEDPGQVALSGSVGGIILVEVPGAITEKMQLVSVKAGKEVKVGEEATEINTSNLFAQPPTKVQITVKNVGNSFLKPFGKVTVTDWSGKTVYSYEMNATDPRGNVLPNTERTFTDDLKNIGSFGRYTISTGISYGDGGDVLIQESTFWVIPIWVVALAAIVIVLIVVGIVMLVRRFKKK